jgi:hypothetical protein
MFLKKHLCSSRQCDILVRDEECLNDPKNFYIGTKPGADLVKPFSRSQLILALENRYKTLDTSKDQDYEKKEEHMNFEVLQKRIEYLTKKYQEDIINSIKVFYEK